MPWKEVKPVNQKLRFIGDYLNGYFDVTELCSRFGISRFSRQRPTVNKFASALFLIRGG